MALSFDFAVFLSPEIVERGLSPKLSLSLTLESVEKVAEVISRQEKVFTLFKKLPLDVKVQIFENSAISTQVNGSWGTVTETSGIKVDFSALFPMLDAYEEGSIPLDQIVNFASNVNVNASVLKVTETLEILVTI